jgi:cyclic pyranopterin phosphate synthase
MPEEEYVWLPRADILDFEEIHRLVRIFTRLGVTRVRLTGGEPLLRRNVPALVECLARTPGIEDLALTTNGVLLADQAVALQRAGLHRLTVSLDTLEPGRFEQLTRFDALDSVRRGIAAARPLFSTLKVDSVIVRGVNDDELLALLDYAREAGAELRFIEYMDVGGATRWSMASVVSRAEMLGRIEAARGTVTPLDGDDWAPADRYRTADGQVFGIISSTTQPFCRTCDRSRLTADGLWFQCLYARDGMDLRALVRGAASDESIADALADAWRQRSDRGAELRAAERVRTPFVPISRLRKDPHLEMHTRGG